MTLGDQGITPSALQEILMYRRKRISGLHLNIGLKPVYYPHSIGPLPNLRRISLCGSLGAPYWHIDLLYGLIPRKHMKSSSSGTYYIYLSTMRVYCFPRIFAKLHTLHLKGCYLFAVPDFVQAISSSAITLEDLRVHACRWNIANNLTVELTVEFPRFRRLCVTDSVGEHLMVHMKFPVVEGQTLFSGVCPELGLYINVENCQDLRLLGAAVCPCS